MTKKKKKANMSQISVLNRIKTRGVKLDFSENQSDEILVSGVQKGSEVAFNHLYAKYEGKLMGYLYSKLKNQEIAEEIFQISWSKVLNSIHRYKFSESFSSWLFTIANNSAKDWFKKTTNQHKVLESLKYATFDDTFTSDSNLELSFLKADAKKVIELQYIKGFSSKEISQSLGLSESNVRKISSRAKKQIKNHILQGGSL